MVRHGSLTSRPPRKSRQIDQHDRPTNRRTGGLMGDVTLPTNKGVNEMKSNPEDMVTLLV